VNRRAVQRILGMLLILFSVTMLPPLVVSVYYSDGNRAVFIQAFSILQAVGGVLWWPVRRFTGEMRVRDGFLIVALFWLVLGTAGALPFLLSSQPLMTATDSVFEAVSGFTTTGATVLTGLDSLPRSILYYRQQIHWFGGIGIVVLAVALLPVLRIGGMQLLKAETPGPVKDSKLTPRIAGTAKVLWLVYLALTAACALAYWMAGMSPFDAVGHSFATLSTGGFSTHDASFAYFDSPVIDAIAIAFMFAGAVNFSLHYFAWRSRSFVAYFTDPEFKAFVLVLGVAIVLYSAILWSSETKSEVTSAIRAAAFQVVSIQTSTGFLTEDFTVWPAAIPVMLMFSTFISGCAGSTAGGMKMIRWLLLWRQGNREVRQLVHPSAELPVKVGGRPVYPRIIDAVWGFFAVYIVSFVVLMIGLLAVGEDQVTAFSAIATCMNNTGPGLGKVAANFKELGDAGKWICVVAMLLGRLEVFPFLLLLTPAFWRR